MGVDRPQPSDEATLFSFDKEGRMIIDYDVARAEADIVESHDSFAWLKKFDDIIARKGFAPHSRSELNTAHYLLNDMFEVGGAAKYVAQVVRHQKLIEAQKKPADIKRDAAGRPPSERVASAITRTIVGYHKDARLTIDSLQVFVNTLVDAAGDDRQVKVGDLPVDFTALYQDPSLQKALSAVARAQDTAFMIAHEASIYDNNYVDADDELLRAKWRFIVDTHSVDGMLDSLHGTAHIERRRLEFWDVQINGQPATLEAPRRHGLRDIQDETVRAILHAAEV